MVSGDDSAKKGTQLSLIEKSYIKHGVLQSYIKHFVGFFEQWSHNIVVMEKLCFFSLTQQIDLCRII